jgi:biotin/methionine sulfoxide reductase
VASTYRPHTSHWGAFETLVEDGQTVTIRPHPHDPDPSPILNNIPDTIRSSARIAQPMIRSGWLERGPGPSERRGADPFVPVEWDELTELLAGELRRVYETHGGEAVYAGSYGWASAGRFHHAQSQLHRFLNTLGGYVEKVNTYSNAAADVILPHVISPMRLLHTHATTWPVIVEHTDLIVCFGGVPLKNTHVNPGGVTRHTIKNHLCTARERGVEFVLFSPVRDDLPDFLDVTWQPVRPGTDVAVMLGIAHTLLTEKLHDRGFLDRYCVGFDRFERYLLGETDGQPKTAAWAETISGIPADDIIALARRMAASRTLVTVSWSLQRTDHGEQAPWMGVALAAMLGQIGLPGGGYGNGYGSMSYIGEPVPSLNVPALSQGTNRVSTIIPVARVSDMLLNPGAPFQYNGFDLTYPDIKLVYWSGGNPFHHHQDLGKFRRALARAETIVINDPFWTGMARHADIVLPATISLERDDIGAAATDPYIIAMHKAIEPFEQARNEYDIFSDLAAALGVEAAFTEGRSADDWLRYLYDGMLKRAAARDFPLPSFDEFWEMGHVRLPVIDDEPVLFASFRNDPESNPLPTPSGRIEIFSETIDSYGYDDCPGHPVWMEPAEWSGSAKATHYPLHLIANNPKTRLHSQLDPGANSQASKIKGREPVRIHPDDATTRGIAEGDVVRLFNDRGSCLAGAVISDLVRPGVVQLSTGAWYDPIDPADPGSMCVHGNPNVLTLDKGTSKLAQGCSGQHALIEVERWDGELPPIRAYDPPAVNSQRP